MHEHVAEHGADIIHLLSHALGHSIEDTLVLVPFLYLTYLVMEALEHGAAGWSERVVTRAGKAGPVLGALLGALPQCGFSAMGATLFSGRVVTLGTLVAVFLSTSDEMLPVFIASGAPLGQIAAILVFKVVVGMVVGLLVDLSVRVLRIPIDRKLRISELCRQDHCDCGVEDMDACEQCNPPAEPECCCGHEHGHDHGCDCGHESREDVERLAEEVYEGDGHVRDAQDGTCCPGCGHDLAPEMARAHEHGHEGHEHHHHRGSIWRSALVHTAQVTLFVFLVTLALELVIVFVGTDAFASFMQGNPVFAVFSSALFGLVPNCAASVVISELYLEGAIGSGAMIAGLLVGAGVGLLVLFRANRPQSVNVAVIGVLYVVGVVCGLIVNASGFVF